MRADGDGLDADGTYAGPTPGFDPILQLTAVQAVRLHCDYLFEAALTRRQERLDSVTGERATVDEYLVGRGPDEVVREVDLGRRSRRREGPIVEKEPPADLREVLGPGFGIRPDGGGRGDLRRTLGELLGDPEDEARRMWPRQGP